MASDTSADQLLSSTNEPTKEQALAQESTKEQGPNETLKRHLENPKDKFERKRAEIAQRKPKPRDPDVPRDPNVPREPRLPKRKVACLIGYCGTGYHGMQLNPPQKTIEGDLFEAFVKAGAVSKDNADDPKKSSFLRAARTDKGVHAAGNVVSLKLIIEDPDIVVKINSHLPETIRMWGYYRTNKSFECRKMCNSRVYEYLMPSYAFLPPKPGSALAELIDLSRAKSPEFHKDMFDGPEFWKKTTKMLEEAGISESDILKCRQLEQYEFDARAKEVPEEEIKNNVRSMNNLIKKVKSIETESKRSYRISQERLEKIRAAFKVYKGVHGFHNFTLGKDANDPSATRVMKSLEVSDPFLIDGTEWLSIKIHGQSFMLHQIRKMVALATLIVRCGCPISKMEEAFGPKRVNIPKAPSLGLLLERPVYDGFNLRLEKLGHEPIKFDKWQTEIDVFKSKYIYDKIYAEEKRENVFNGFFGFIDSFRGGDVLKFLVAEGIAEEENSEKVPSVKMEEDEEDEEAFSDES